MIRHSSSLLPKAALTAGLALSLGLAGDSLAQGTTVLDSGILLSELIANDGTITVGDKEFSDFSYAATGDAPPATGVNVFGIIDEIGNFGLRFQGGFFDAPGDGASDSLITYLITVTDPNNAIIGARMQGNTDIVGNGNGPSFATVTDTFLPQVTDENLTIFESRAEGVDLDNSLFFGTSFTVLNAQKDILMFAADGDVATTVSFVDQTYYQIPEPTSLALLGLGAAMTMRRRRDR